MNQLSQKRTNMHACRMCNEIHDLDECDIYRGRPLEGRMQFLIQHRLCFACYHPIGYQHNARTCPRGRTCRVCAGLHPTGLHGYRSRQPQARIENQSAQSDLSTPRNTKEVRLPGQAPSPVHILRDGGGCRNDGDEHCNGASEVW